MPSSVGVVEPPVADPFPLVGISDCSAVMNSSSADGGTGWNRDFRLDGRTLDRLSRGGRGYVGQVGRGRFHRRHFAGDLLRQ